MGLIRESVIELFQIAIRDYYLAVAILEKGNFKITFEELSFHCGSRSRNMYPFIERALLSIDEESLDKEVLIKKIKDRVHIRANASIYVLLKYKEEEVDVSDIFLCNKMNTWEKNNEVILHAAQNIKIGDDSFDELIVAYITGDSTKRDLAEVMLMRLPKSSLSFEYLDKFKFRAFDCTGIICRALLLKHFAESIKNDDLIKMYRKDYSGDVSLYLEYWEQKSKQNLIPKNFWNECLESNHSEVRELAINFLRYYALSEPQESEMKIFFGTYPI